MIVTLMPLSAIAALRLVRRERRHVNEDHTARLNDVADRCPDQLSCSGVRQYNKRRIDISSPHRAYRRGQIVDLAHRDDDDGVRDG
jgi:hypothetical protein